MKECYQGDATPQGKHVGKCRLTLMAPNGWVEDAVALIELGDMMRTDLLIAALLAAAYGAVAAPAGAVQIDVSLQDPLVNSGNLTDLGTFATVDLRGHYGDFFYAITASDITGSDFVSSLDVGSTVLPPGGGTLTVYVTELGLTSPGLNELFNSSLAENSLRSDETTTLSASLTQQFVTPSQLALATYSGQGATVTSVNEGVSGVYSLTERYAFSPSVVNGQSRPTIGVSRSAGVGASASPIPETSTWAMLGIGFGGLALAAAAKRRRKDSRFVL